MSHNYPQQLKAEMSRIFALAIQKVKDGDPFVQRGNVRGLVNLKIQDTLRDHNIPFFTEAHNASPQAQYWNDQFLSQLNKEV